MNLLSDRWIPVSDGASMTQISMEELLCSDRCYSICHPRDDMELAALQLLVCLTQAVLTPEDDEELRGRLETPLDQVEYREAAAVKMDWFDLEHEKTPFMQDFRAKKGSYSKIQKLFPGLPGGESSQCLFNSSSEVLSVCPSCAAIALFNQGASGLPWGSGYKNSLRKSSAISIFIYDISLRKMVWKNILPIKFIEEKMVFSSASRDVPVWIDLIQGEVINPIDIGFLRGIMWQSNSILFDWDSSMKRCSVCGNDLERGIIGFYKKGIPYKLMDDVVWAHPYSSFFYDLKNQSRAVVYDFQEFPSWARLPQIIPMGEKAWMAFSVEHYIKMALYDEVALSIGGYAMNNKNISLIMARHHEFFSMGHGWTSHLKDINERVILALQYEEALQVELGDLDKNIFYKNNEKKARENPKLKKTGRRIFFQRTESLMHEVLQYTEWDREKEFRLKLADRLEVLCSKILEEVARPYLDQPDGVLAYATARKNLKAAMNKLHKSIE